MEYFQKALSTREKVFGKEHLTTANSYHNIGIVYEYMDNYKMALKFFIKALEIQEKMLGFDHPDVLESYNNIGTRYRKLGDYQNALVYRQKELDYYLRNSRENVIETASAYNNVGAQYRDLKQYDKAIEYITKAYEIAENIGDTISKAGFLNRLGRVYALMGEDETAKAKFLEAITLLPKDHPEAIDSQKRLDDIHNK